MHRITAPPPTDPDDADDLLALWRSVRGSTAFVGETIEAGAPPWFWTEDFVRSKQAVSVRVVDSICGDAPASPLELGLTTMEGGRDAAPTPGLASWITTPGSRVVYIIEAGAVWRDDPAPMRADPTLIAWLRDACASDAPPAGIPGVLYEFVAAVQTDHALAASFAAVPPASLDVVDGGRTVARLTVVKGRLDVSSGAAREVRPDVTLRASAAQLADALTGATAPDALVVGGAAPELLRAIATAAGRLGPDASARVRAATSP